MTKLTIQEVRNVDFGGLHLSHLSGLGEDFVVIYGRNEAGKSSMAEFISWMIAGPEGDTASQARFGIYGQQVGGRVLGVVGDKALDLDGKFSIMAKGLPSDEGNKSSGPARRGTLAGTPIDSVLMRTQLGQMQPNDFGLLYRLRADTMHIIDNETGFQTLMAKYATGSIDSGINPREVLARLTARINNYSKRIKELNSDLGTLKKNIAEASLRPQLVRELESRVADLTAELEDARRQEEAARTHELVVEAALKLFSKQEELRAAQRALQDTPPVPNDFQPIVTVLDEIVRAANEVLHFSDRKQDIQGDVNARTSGIGLGYADLARHELTDADRQVFRDGADACSSARSALASTTRELQEVEQRIELLTSRMADAVAGCGVDHSSLVASVDQLPKLRDLGNDANQSDIAFARINAAKNEVNVKRAEREAAQRNVDALSLSPVKVGGTGRIQTAVFIGTALLAAGAARVGVMASVAIAVVGIAGALLLGRRTASPVGDSSAELAEARTVLATRMQDESTAQKKLDEAVNSAETLCGDLNTKLAGLGFPLATAGSCLAHISNIEKALDVIGELRDARDSHAGLSGQRKSQETAVEVSEAVYGRLFKDRGFASAPQPEAIQSWIDRYASAISASKELAAVESSLESARGELNNLIGVVPGLVTLGSPQAVVAEVNRVKAMKQDYDTAAARLTEVSAEFDLLVGGSDAVRQVVESAQSREEIQVALEAARQARIDAGHARDHISTQLGAAADQVKASSVDEVLAGFLESRDTALEELEEVVHQQAVASLAAETLRTVIGKYELANQGPLVARAQELINQVDANFGSLFVDRSGSQPTFQIERNGQRFDVSKLSTGARTIVYVALRLAFAEIDTDTRGVAVPLICDDPLISVDDERLQPALALLKNAAARRQVMLFTCHARTVHAAQSLGAKVVEL